jgi:hypothetical protein
MPFIRACRFLCAVALAYVFATPASAQSANTTIRIGAVVDQTGGSTSPHYRAAIELAGRQMNEALAQAGSKVRFEISFGDSKSNPPFAQQEALSRAGVLCWSPVPVTTAIRPLNASSTAATARSAGTARSARS